MELSSSPRLGKIKTISNQSVYMYLDKISPIHTPTGSKRIPRASSLAESKKPSKANSMYNQKTLKFKPRLETQLDSINKIQRSPVSRNMIVNFVNESKTQELRILKSEMVSLKSCLNQMSAELSNFKENYENAIKSFEEERNLYRIEYLRLVEFIASQSKIDLKMKLEVSELAKASQLCRDPITVNSLCALQEKLIANPFEVTQSLRSLENTARFCSLTESQAKEILAPSIEGIVLEDFSYDHEGFLQLKAGDRVEVLGVHDETWWIGRLDSHVGRFPRGVLLVD